MSEIRTNILISGESLEYRSNIEISIVTLNSTLVDTHSSFRTTLDISTKDNIGNVNAIRTTLELNNVELKFYLVDMTKLNQSILYFSKFFNMNFEPEVMWDLLSQGTKEQINITHLTEALSNYITNADITSITSSINILSNNLNTHIKDDNRHFTEKEKKFLLSLLENPNILGSGDSLFEKISITENNVAIPAVKPLRQDNKEVGIISNTFISCRGLDSTSADSNAGIIRSDLFTILSGDPVSDSEFINNKFLKISPLIENWIRNNLKSYESDPTVPFWVKAITTEQIYIWDLITSLFRPSEDNTYVYTTNNRGFVSNSFISCRGIDNSASSSSSLTRNDLFSILSGPPQEGEKINLQYLIGLGDLIDSLGYIKSINKNQVIAALGYIPLAKDNFKDFDAVSNIIKQDVDNWNFVFSLIGLSEDKTYIFPKEGRGIVSNSFISCRGLDNSVAQIGGGTFDRESLFNILSGEPQNGEFINLKYIDLSNYATTDFVISQGYITSNYLTGYATEQWVKQQGYLTQHQDLSAYAKSADVANTYATKVALQTLQNEHNALSTKVTNLDNLLNSDVSGVINTWGEVVDFLDEYSGSEDLATILAGMNNDIANRVLIEDFEKLEGSVTEIAGYFTNGSANNALKLGGQLPSYYATVDALNLVKKDVTAVSNRVQKFEDVIGIDANGDVYIKGTRNFYTEGGTIGMAGLGSGGSGGGGTAGLGSVTVRVNGQDYITDASGIVTIPSYPTSLPASDVYSWAKAATKPTYTASEVGALSLSGGTINGLLYIDSTAITDQPLALRSMYADNAGACRIQFIDANNAFQGYVMSGWGNLLLAHRSYNQIGVGDSGIWCSSDNGTTKNTLIHTGNIGSYAFIPRADNLISNVDADHYWSNGAYLNQTGNGSGNSNFPNNYAMFLSFNNGASNYVTQFDMGRGAAYYRTKIDTWSKWYQFITDENIGSQSVNYANSAGNADTLDGYHADGFALSVGSSLLPTWVNCLGYGYGHNDWLIYGPALTFGVSTYYARIQKGHNDNSLYLSGWSSELGELGWREFAFTDSNVASATKLQTARTIWGQSFDGTGNIDNTLTITNPTAEAINITRTDGGWAYINYEVTGSVWHVGVPGTSNTGMLGTSGDYEIRSLNQDYGYYTGLSIRPNTSSYGKVVISSHSSECSIGFRNTSDITVVPQWVFGMKGTSQFGVWSTEAGRFIITTTPSVMTSTIPMVFETPTTAINNYNEGVRFNLGGQDNWAGFVIGGARGSISGSSEGVYSFLVNNKNLMFRHETENFLEVNTLKDVVWRPRYFAIVSGNSECGIRFGGVDANNDFVGRFSTYVSLYNVKNSSNEIKIPDAGSATIGGNTIWHAGNSNISTVNWSANKISCGLLAMNHTVIGPTLDLKHTNSSYAWNYINQESNGYTWHIGICSTCEGSDQLEPGAYEIRGNGGSYQGIFIRPNTSSYGKLVVANNTGAETSIGFLNTRHSYDYPVWTVGTSIGDGSVTTFGWYYSNAGARAWLTAEGNLTVTGDIISEGTMAMAKLASSSDRKLKDNIAGVSAEQSMSIIRQLRPTTWNWKKDGKKSYGFIAQEVEPIVPEMVVNMGHLHLEYNQLHAFEIGAIQHIDSEVEILKRRVNELENELKQYRRNA